MQFIVFFLIAVSILAAGYAYVGWRLIPSAELSNLRKTVGWLGLALLFVLPVLTFLLEIRRIENKWLDLFSWAGYVSLGFFSMTFTLVLFRDLAWILAVGAQKVVLFGKEVLSSAKNSLQLTDPDRRQFLVESMNLGLLGAAGVLTAYGIYEARRRPATVEITIPIANLPESLEGFRIVQITDIHAGLTVTRPFVQTVVERVEGLRPDLIAFTGDLADGSVGHLR